MKTFTHNWRIVFVTLLIGFLASVTGISAMADTVIADASWSTDLSGIAPWSPNFNGGKSICSSTKGYSCQWHWNFGDNTSSDPAVDATGAQSTTHIYKFGGTYTVTLTVTMMVPTGVKPKSSTTLQVTVQQGETLTSYVNTCKQQLGFNDADIPTNLNCTKGVRFAPHVLGPQINDYMGYARVTDQVDLVFACRWLTNGDGGNDQNIVPPFIAAASIEMIISNRQSGKACFFKAQDQTVQGPIGPINVSAPVAIVSPTVAAAAAPNTPEANFWDAPIVIDRELQCVDCHVAGPYIATPRIAPFLGQFGLLNNGHDTYGLTLDSNGNPVGNYHIVGSTFAHFNNLAATNNNASTSICSGGCHSIGYNGQQFDVVRGLGNTLLPSIIHVIDQSGAVTPDISVRTSGVMPPLGDDTSDYRWINLDTPTNSTPSSGVETENFADAMNATSTLVPHLFDYEYYCPQPNVPSALEAHIVGSDNVFFVNQSSRFAFLPDRLSVFNVKDGLVCLNGDQDNGQQCQNYSIQYECTDPTGKKTLTQWYNMDSPSGDGDHEERSNDANVCTSPSGSIATGIQASFVASNGWTYTAFGPNDRLANFSPYGLTCNNSDQPDAKCSNYVVRYSGCVVSPAQSNKTLTNVFAVGKQLTAASSSLAKGQSHNGGTTQQWNTQAWNLEPVLNTEYVRVHNPGTNVYLTVTSTAEQATVGTATSNTTTNEMWLIEPVTNSTNVRLKNRFSGKYLTIADPKNFTSTPDYLPIYSQGRNTGWTSQLWIIQ